MAKNSKDDELEVAEWLISELEIARTAIEKGKPWGTPWNAPLSAFPANPITAKDYKGQNVIKLLIQRRSDPRWMTYKQAEAKGWQVRKGEKSTAIKYYKTEDEKTDAQGRKYKVTLDQPRAFYAYLFNAEQMDGIPALAPLEPISWSEHERLEMLVNDSGVKVVHGGSRAYYRPSTDTIHLPPKEAFPDLQSYSSTLLHELGHATGHESRLKRLHQKADFGSEEYSREELVAEITSLMLGASFDIPHSPEQHSGYIGHWIKVLKDDPREIYRAAAQATKAKDHILAWEKTWLLTHEAELKEHRDARFQEPEKQTQQDLNQVFVERAARFPVTASIPWPYPNQADNGGSVSELAVPLLLEFSEVFRGQHPSVTDGADARSHAEHYIRELAGVAPEFSKAAAKIWTAQRHELASQTGLTPDRIHATANVLFWEADQQLVRQNRPLVADELGLEWAHRAEHLRAVAQGWKHDGDAQNAAARLSQAASYFREGEWDKAHELLRDVRSYESLQENGRAQMSNFFDEVDSTWRKWQEQNGLGEVVTPKMKGDFEGIPKNLAELSAGSLDSTRSEQGLDQSRVGYARGGR